MTRLINRSRIAGIVLLLSVIMAACGDDGPASSSSSSTRAATPTSINEQPAQTATSTTPSAQNANPTTTPTVVIPALPSAPVDPRSSATPLTLPTPRPIEQTPAPVRLRIPALGIDTAVQWVGVDDDGRMAVPSNYSEVAWYELGASPGTPGNAVIAGHLDSTTGPAIFFRLEDLKPGDEIITVTHDGQEFRFIVTASEVYDADDAPRERIFGPAVLPRLNLITCDGVFDRSQRQYDKRLVVYSELASEV